MVFYRTKTIYGRISKFIENSTYYSAFYSYLNLMNLSKYPFSLWVFNFEFSSNTICFRARLYAGPCLSWFPIFLRATKFTEIKVPFQSSVLFYVPCVIITFFQDKNVYFGFFVLYQRSISDISMHYSTVQL